MVAWEVEKGYDLAKLKHCVEKAWGAGLGFHHHHHQFRVCTFLQGIVRSVLANLVSYGDGRSEIGAGAVARRFGGVRHIRGSQNT